MLLVIRKIVLLHDYENYSEEFNAIDEETNGKFLSLKSRLRKYVGDRNNSRWLLKEIIDTHNMIII